MKRGVKIVILFVVIIALLYGGWYMYKRLEYNKQSFATDIYQYVSAQAIEVININKTYNADKLYTYYSPSVELLNILGDQIYPPIIISRYAKEKNVLTMRVGKEEEELIKEHITKDIAIPYLPKKLYYKDNEIFIYALKNDKFLACTFYKGLLIMSYNYKLVKNIMDTDPENYFFSDKDYKKTLKDAINKYPISVFVKLQDNDILAMDYNCKNDTITLDGYLLSKANNDSITSTNKLIPFLISVPDSICIDGYEIYNENNLTKAKITLNKIY